MPEKPRGMINDDFGAGGATASQVNSVPGGQDNSSTVAGAASDAQQMAIQIIKQASQGGQNPITNRPQVILPQPRVPKQIPMGQSTGNVQATTQSGQRRNDMNSLISSVGNIVKTGINKKREKDEQGLMHDLAIIQAASSNPEDPHNKLILDQMMNDPKVVKRLQKALGYNPLAGEEPSPEAKTLMKFGAQVKQKQAIQTQGSQPQSNGQQPQGGTPQQGGAMQNLMSRMPNTQQINPTVAMQAELIKAGILPKNDLGPKALMDYVQEVMKDDTKREELKARAQATNNQTLMKLYETTIRAQAYLDRGREADKSKEKVAATHLEGTKYAADARERAAAERTDKKYGKDTFKNLKIAAEMYDKDLTNLREQLNTALKQSGGKENDQTKALHEQITSKESLKRSVEEITNKELSMPTPSGVSELEQSETPPTEDMNFGDMVFPSTQH